MTNEEVLFGLIISREPESILVAQDLAMELNCGLSLFLNHSTMLLGSILNSGIAGRRLSQASIAGKQGNWGDMAYHSSPSLWSYSMVGKNKIQISCIGSPATICSVK